jgi:hypothetical protein
VTATAVIERAQRAIRPAGFPSPYIPHVPHVKQQVGLLLDDKLEGLFGGAAGGGKSDWLLMAALQYVHVNGYAALLLRKTYADLSKPGALIPRSKQWLAGKATYNESSHTWSFNTGSTISFGFIRNDNDLEQYQSAEYQFIGFDELTHFSERQYTYMFSRLRKPAPPESDPGEDSPEQARVRALAAVPLRVRGASNPGGRGHDWAKRRFVDKATRSKGAFFLPSRIDDNPSLDKHMYLMSMEQLDEATRAQLLLGDWEAREPGNWMIHDNRWIDAAVALGREWSDMYKIPQPVGGAIEVGIDWGEFTQSYVIWPLPNGGVYVPPSETVGRHEDPASVAPRIFREAVKFGLPIRSWRYDAAGVQSMRTFMNITRAQDGHDGDVAVKVAFSKYKRLTINYLNMLFRRAFEGHESAVIAIHPYNEELIRQLKFWERKDEESEDAKKEDDHGPDALVAGVSGIASKNQAMIESMISQSYKSDSAPLAQMPDVLKAA